MKAQVTVMLKDGVLDSQGKAIQHALDHMGFSGVASVRAGKIFELDLAGAGSEQARAAADEVARRLLANSVIESYKVEMLP